MSYPHILERSKTTEIPLSVIAETAVKHNISYQQLIQDVTTINPEINIIELSVDFERIAGDETPINTLQDKGVFTLMDVSNDIIQLKRNPKSDEGNPLGWMGVKMTLKPEIYVITGIPGSGKTAWVDNVIMNSIRQHGYKWAIFSPEQLPVENHTKTLIEIATESNFYGRYDTRPTPEDSITGFISSLNEHLFFLNPPTEEGLKIDSILKVIEELVYDYGVNAFVLDPYNEFSHTRDMKISETEYVSQFFQKIRRFVKKHNCMCWVVAHPTKLKKNEDGTYPIPTAYDISGSANFYNKADQIIVVHREKNREKNPENIVQIVVQKIKHKGTGELGMYELKYNYGDGTYSHTPRMSEEDYR